jgi:hypothetical protein
LAQLRWVLSGNGDIDFNDITASISHLRIPLF